jgi:translation initiation factor IF-2
MGHVDHGKTTLLDAIRESAVVETEAGGITQHIGAYQVDHDGRRVTFLDTPGHEAFTALRARGAKVTDIAVLVVAADDGVMPRPSSPSTTRARRGADRRRGEQDRPARIQPDPRAAGARRRTTSSRRSGEGRRSTQDVSAKEQQGLDELVEKVLLVADAELELTANPKAEASVRSSRAGWTSAAAPSRPCSSLAEPSGRRRNRRRRRLGEGARAPRLSRREGQGGAPGHARSRSSASTSRRPRARTRASSRTSARPAISRACAPSVCAPSSSRGARRRASRSEDLFTRIGEGGVQELNVIVKGDVQGSLEAVVGELAKIKHPEVAVNVIHTGIGAITESDVMLASASSAIIAGFNVRPNAEARSAAERDGVDIRTYRVIYQLTEDIQQALVGMLAPEQVEESLGDAEVRALFRASRLGVIAGCMVTRGVIRRNSQIRVVREGAVVYETTIASLKRFKDDVREVQEGFECGILLENFNDVKEGDILEAYETRQIERTDLEVTGGNGRPAARRARRRELSRGRRLRRHPLRRASLPREPLPEGKAEGAPVREGAAAAALRRSRWPKSTTTTSGSAPGSRWRASRASTGSSRSSSTAPSATSTGRRSSSARWSGMW